VETKDPNSGIEKKSLRAPAPLISGLPPFPPKTGGGSQLPVRKRPQNAPSTHPPERQSQQRQVDPDLLMQRSSIKLGQPPLQPQKKQDPGNKPSLLPQPNRKQPPPPPQQQQQQQQGSRQQVQQPPPQRSSRQEPHQGQHSEGASTAAPPVTGRGAFIRVANIHQDDIYREDPREHRSL
jgi:hypothetical protein